MPNASNADERCCPDEIVTSVTPSAASTTNMKTAAIAAKPRSARTRSGNVADVHFMIEVDRLVAARDREPHRHQAVALCEQELRVLDIASGDVLRQHGGGAECPGGLRELDRIA